MKGVIFYYSGTGNTALACRSLASRMPVPFDLVDITRAVDVDLGSADFVGFATSTDFWGVPKALERFVESLPRQEAKPAFVLNTYGAVSGQTLRILLEQVTGKGFDVLAGHSLRMPESYPPMIAGKMGAAGSPGKRELRSFDGFVSELGGLVGALQDGHHVGGHKPQIGVVNGLFPRRARTTARDDMGEKHVDVSACTECGVCERLCPYGAIKLDPKPVFDMSTCYGCWRCYNRCPEHAIYTDKFRGGPYYTGPSKLLREKLGMDAVGKSVEPPAST